MYCNSGATFVLVILSLASYAQNQDIVFTAEPGYIETICGTHEINFPCRYTGSTARPQWVINSTTYSSYHGGLPENHSFNGATGALSVINITPELNNTHYQCQVHLPSGVYQSQVGRLIIRCEAPQVQCLPVYHHEQRRIKTIFTNINQVNGSTNLYLITYSDSESGDICASSFVSTSSCWSGICHHVFEMSASLFCSNSLGINVVVTMTNFHRDMNFTKSDPIRISALNKFIHVSKIRMGVKFGIKCTFIRQAKESSRRFCKVSYGCDWTTPGCNNSSMTLESEGTSDNSRFVEISIDLKPLGNPSKIYFSITANASTDGTKSVKVEGKFNIIATADPDIWCSPYYQYQSLTFDTLTKILTTITMNDDYTTYIIIFSDSESGENCTATTIPATSCKDGICSHLYEVSSQQSQCSKTANINVTISATSNNSRVVFLSKPLKIDYVNSFIRVLFDPTMSTISLNFVNQTKANKKFYLIKYGPTTPGCKKLPLQMEGYLSNSNLISLELNLSLKNVTEICFLVVVNNATNTVNVEGIYKSKFLDSDNRAILSAYMILIIYIATTVALIFAVATLIFIFLYTRVSRLKTREAKLNEQNMEFDQKKLSEKENSEINKIDKSTTYYRLSVVTSDSESDILMDKFAKATYPNYRPVDGYGYYEMDILKLSEVDIDLFWNVILMDEKEDMFSALGSAITDCNGQINWKRIFIQSKSTETILTKGTYFLYCAHSNVVTAYSKEYDITEECSEIDFCEENIRGYRTKWSQHGYYQFSKSGYIKPNQRIIVKKKNGELITGSGVRHRLGATVDGLNLIHPPNLSDHKEWECVFVQSRDLKRKLIPSPSPGKKYKYLFCAMMEQVPETVHYEVYDIQNSCNMAEFAKKHIPGFKLGRGYGYYQFKHKELIKPEKRVVLVDKKKRLFTGPGALFFITGGGYTLDDIRKPVMFLPPSLEGTKWDYIFVQNHSKKRELCANSKFLYLEYREHK